MPRPSEHPPVRGGKMFVDSHIQRIIHATEETIVTLWLWYILQYFCLLKFFWCPCMAINVGVQYNGGLLLDNILLTQCCYHRGIRLNVMEMFCLCSL